MPGLRERRHAQTRSDILEVAFRLFAERGYDDVTMEEIAGAAGISRSTVYRRYASKEDVVLEVPRRWLDAYDAVAEELTPDVSLVDALGATADAVASHIDANIELVKAAYAVIEQAPTLKAAGVATTEWLERVAALVLKHSDHDAEAAGIIAGAFMGALDSMMHLWAARGGTESVVAATRRTHARLRPMLEA